MQPSYSPGPDAPALALPPAQSVHVVPRMNLDIRNVPEDEEASSSGQPSTMLQALIPQRKIKQFYKLLGEPVVRTHMQACGPSGTCMDVCQYVIHGP